VIEDPPACFGEACIEDIEEFAWDCWERCGFVVDVCDCACAGRGVEASLGVDALGLCAWGWGCDECAGMEYACCVDPPDELVC